MTAHFKQSLSFGKLYEYIAVDKIFNNPPDLYHPPGKHAGFDFSTGGLAYEVKACRIAYRSGNFILDFLLNGKLDGIATTTADMFIFFVVYPDDKYKVYIIPTCVIKKVIRENDCFIWTSTASRRLYDSYFIPIHYFSEYLVDALCTTSTMESEA